MWVSSKDATAHCVADCSNCRLRCTLPAKTHPTRSLLFTLHICLRHNTGATILNAWGHRGLCAWVKLAQEMTFSKEKKRLLHLARASLSTSAPCCPRPAAAAIPVCSHSANGWIYREEKEKKQTNQRKVGAAGAPCRKKLAAKLKTLKPKYPVLAYLCAPWRC